jgi:hypothetical protein
LRHGNGRDGHGGESVVNTDTDAQTDGYTHGHPEAYCYAHIHAGPVLCEFYDGGRMRRA